MSMNSGDWLNAWSAGLLGGSQDPAKAANKELDKIPGMEKGYYDPFIQHGKSSYDVFNPVTSQMTSDPAGFLEKMMQSYAPSRGFNLKKDQMLKAAGNSAAAGGMRGSLGDIENESHITDTLMGDDMQQWLQNVFGIQKEGLNSQQHLYDTGYDASKNLAGDLSNVMGTKGTLGFNSAQQHNKSQSDMMATIMKILGGAAGATMGGPGGAAIGSQVGGSIGSSFS